MPERMQRRQEGEPGRVNVQAGRLSAAGDTDSSFGLLLGRTHGEPRQPGLLGGDQLHGSRRSQSPGTRVVRANQLPCASHHPCARGGPSGRRAAAAFAWERFATENRKLWRNASKQRVFREKKTLNGFEFSFQPRLSERRLRERADLSFVQTCTNIVFLGPPVSSSWYTQSPT